MASLREMRTARNKQAILNALLSEMRHQDYDDITIGTLCTIAEVSPASFYNYFPKKSDLLIYYVHLWSLDVNLKVTKNQKRRGLQAIESIFVHTAEAMADHARIMAEIIAFQAKSPSPLNSPILTDADKLVAHPNTPSILEISGSGIESIVLPQLQFAIESGELPIETPIDTVAYTIRSIFFAIPMILRQFPLNEISRIYMEQLSLIWAGIRTKYQKGVS